MIYIFDYDGTIVDVWFRYHKIFTSFFKYNISLEDYKERKLQYENDYLFIKDIITNVSEGEIKAYFNYKNFFLEDPDFTKNDRVIININNFNNFIKKNNVYILSARNNNAELLKQVKNIGINILDNRVISVKNEGLTTKYKYIEENFKVNEEITIIGDSDVDQYAANLKNVTFKYVDTGLKRLLNEEVIDINKFIKEV